MGAFKKIGILPSGGDCAGLNAVIRAATEAATGRGWTVLGLRNGHLGLLATPPDVVDLTTDVVRADLLRAGGTMLGTTTTGDPFAFPDADGRRRDRSGEVIAAIKSLGLEALIVIGGDGSMRVFDRLLTPAGIPWVGVPKTIDNDYVDSELAVGFTSAVNVAAEAILRVNTSGTSHGRVMVVEVMGRHAGYIALNAGIAAGADAILIPERPFSREGLAMHLKEKVLTRKKHAIVVCAEGAHAEGEELQYRSSASGSRHLGGVGDAVASFLHDALDRETRCTSLGHTQRGSQADPVDRILAARFATRAIRLAHENRFGSMVVLRKGEVEVASYPKARSRGGAAARCLIPSDPTIIAAEDMGIYCGELP